MCYDKVSYLCFKCIVQVVFEEDDSQYTRSSFELVKCKLTLFYDYWQLNEVFHLASIIC